MKPLISLLLLIPNLVFASVSLDGEFSCTVKSIQTTEVKNGQPTLSNNSVFKEGEVVPLKYFSTDVAPKHWSWKKDHLFLTFEKSEKKSLIGTILKPFNFSLNNQKSVEMKGLFPLDFMYFDEDHFFVNTNVSRLSLHRYYKSDWGGYITEFSKERATTLSVDCRTVRDDFAKLLQLPHN